MINFAIGFYHFLIMITKSYLSTLLASSMHFCADALCLCCLYLITGDGVDYLVYNVLAFLTQPFTGIVVDRIRNKYKVLFSAVVLFFMAAAMAVLTPGFMTVVAVMLGVGNSLFHVWGGREVAVVTRNDARALGVFVSPGVLGLAVGAVLCSWQLLFLLLMMIGILATVHYCMVGGGAVDRVGDSAVGSGHGKYVIGLMIAICAFVMLRSYLAGEFSTTTNSGAGYMVLVAAAVAMSGKILGGFLARIAQSYVVAFVVFTAVSLVCLLARNYWGHAVFVGLFAINCTMPLTLYWAEKLMPGREGFAFGLLAASLMPPYIFSVML